MTNAPKDIKQVAIAAAQEMLGGLWRGRDMEIIADAIFSERKRCTDIARHKAAHAHDDCECLGFMDPETGQRECAIEARGSDCLCQVAAEMAEEIARTIEEDDDNG